MRIRKTFFILILALFVFAAPSQSAPKKLITTEPDSVSTDSGRKSNKPDLKATITQKKEEFKNMLEEVRKEASESFKQNKLEFQQRLQLIRDEKKKQLVTRINENLTNVNTRQTDKMMAALEKLNSILGQLVDKINTASEAGKDITSANESVLEAQKSIENAQEAVASQAAKIYTIEIIDEQTLKLTVGQAVSQMRADLKSVRSVVVAAKQKVARVIREVARLGIRGKNIIP